MQLDWNTGLVKHLGIRFVETEKDRIVAELDIRLERKGPWEHGRVLAAAADPSGGPCEAAASPRFAVAYAIALP